MAIHDSILDTIGRTPVVKLHRIAPAHVELYAKVEAFNPAGSVKDRLALAIILDAEARGALKPGDTIVEATSGNTGVALAAVAAARGYKFVAVMTETFSIERRKLIRAYGAKVILTPAAERGTGMVRKAEELEFLRAHGIGFKVVPGITAALACAAYAGIPLTHRNHAQSVRLLTAHCRDGVDTLDWDALARDRQTLAVYMGVAGLDRLRDHLLASGRDPATPFALVENGSRPEQRVVTGRLHDLPDSARAHAVASPALLILGEVAALAGQLHWFGAAPLGPPAPALAQAA